MDIAVTNTVVIRTAPIARKPPVEIVMNGDVVSTLGVGLKLASNVVSTTVAIL